MDADSGTQRRIKKGLTPLETSSSTLLKDVVNSEDDVVNTFSLAAAQELNKWVKRANQALLTG